MRRISAFGVLWLIVTGVLGLAGGAVMVGWAAVILGWYAMETWGVVTRTGVCYGIQCSLPQLVAIVSLIVGLVLVLFGAVYRWAGVDLRRGRPWARYRICALVLVGFFMAPICWALVVVGLGNASFREWEPPDLAYAMLLVSVLVANFVALVGVLFWEPAES